MLCLKIILSFLESAFTALSCKSFHLRQNFPDISYGNTIFYNLICIPLGCKNGQVYCSMVILIKSYEALESLFRKFLEIELGLRARQAC